jgi:endo-1,3(4)-beta-glucanase
MVRYYAEMLTAYGPPQRAVTADGPYGMALGSADRPALVAVNPTAKRLTVHFHRDGRQIAALTVEPRQAVTHRL